MIKRFVRPGLARSLTWNYFGYLYEMMVGVVLVPYIVHYIGVEKYGAVILSLSLGGMAALLDCGFSGVLVQEYVVARCARHPGPLNRLFNAAFTAMLLLGFIGFLVCALLAWALHDRLHASQELHSIAIPVLLITGLNVQVSLPLRSVEMLYEAAKRFDTINQAQVVVTTLRLITTVILLEHGGAVVTLVLIQLAAACGRLLLLVAPLRTFIPGVSLRPIWSWDILRPVWRKSNWGLLDSISRQLGSSGEAFFLAAFSSVGAVAVYGIGSKLPTQLNTIVGRGAAVTFPRLAEYHATDEISALRTLYIEMSGLIMSLVLPIVILGMVFALPITEVWLGQQYKQAATVMRWLLLATLSGSVELPADLVLYSRGRIATAARLSLLRSCARLALGICLVPHYGAVGLAAGIATADISFNLLCFVPIAVRTAGIRVRFAALNLGRVLILPLTLTPALLPAMIAAKMIWSPAVQLAAGGVIGLVYLVVWTAVVALPLLRGQTRLQADIRVLPCA